jgi:hypothetical protein
MFIAMGLYLPSFESSHLAIKIQYALIYQKSETGR